MRPGPESQQHRVDPGPRSPGCGEQPSSKRRQRRAQRSVPLERQLGDRSLRIGRFDLRKRNKDLLHDQPAGRVAGHHKPVGRQQNEVWHFWPKDLELKAALDHRGSIGKRDHRLLQVTGGKTVSQDPHAPPPPPRVIGKSNYQYIRIQCGLKRFHGEKSPVGPSGDWCFIEPTKASPSDCSGDTHKWEVPPATWPGRRLGSEE